MLNKAVLAAAAMSLFAGAASANLLTNGNFEADVIPSPPGFTNTVTGWTVGGGGVNLMQPCCNFTTQVVDLFGEANSAFGSISQSWTAQQTHVHTLSWDESSNQSAPPTRYSVTFTGADPVNPGNMTVEFDVGVAGISGGSLGPEATTFAANAGGTFSRTLTWWSPVGQTATVTFAALSSLGNGGAVIDNVVLTAVPEPGTYALMLAGLGVVAWAARRRKSQSAAEPVATPA